MNIYQETTERILKQLEAGVIPWRKTWTSGIPKSLNSGKEYRGINLLLLSLNDYRSRYWLTYRQAIKLGGFVRKGEKSSPVVYWKWRTEEELRALAAKTGKDVLAPCHPFVSHVFNLDQIEGILRPDDDVQQKPENRLQMADMVFGTMPDKPEIVHGTAAQPAYYPATDAVTLPGLTQFESTDHYYAVLFHELVHSTGHHKRLNRFAEEESGMNQKYSYEELVAEFGSAFLCGFAGIRNPVQEALQASYIEGWSAVFKQDSKILLRAASSAQRAADYVRGKLVAKGAPTASIEEPMVLSA